MILCVSSQCWLLWKYSTATRSPLSFCFHVSFICLLLSHDGEQTMFKTKSKIIMNMQTHESFQKNKDEQRRWSPLHALYVSPFPYYTFLHLPIFFPFLPSTPSFPLSQLWNMGSAENHAMFAHSCNSRLSFRNPFSFLFRSSSEKNLLIWMTIEQASKAQQRFDWLIVWFIDLY